jgi:hypothetical protein
MSSVGESSSVITDARADNAKDMSDLVHDGDTIVNPLGGRSSLVATFSDQSVSPDDDTFYDVSGELSPKEKDSVSEDIDDHIDVYAVPASTIAPLFKISSNFDSSAANLGSFS